MKAKPHCIVLTNDTDLQQRLEGFLKLRTQCESRDPNACNEPPSEIGSTALLLLDLRIWQTNNSIRTSLTEHQKKFVLLFGDRRSEPALEAQRDGLNRITPLDFSRLDLQSQIEQMHEHLLTHMQLSSLKARMHEQQPPATHSPESPYSQVIATQLTRSLQHLRDIESFFSEAARIVSQAISAARIVIVTLDDHSQHFAVRTGLRSKEGSAEIKEPINGLLATHLREKASALTRNTLFERTSRDEALELSRIMDTYGVDVIAPLFGRTLLLGWLMVGSKATGKPLNDDDLNDLMLISEDLSPVIENALQSEKNKLKKNLLENVFQALPTGLIALNAEEQVLWLNSSAETLLGKSFSELLNKHYKEIDPSIAEHIPNLLAYALADRQGEPPIELSNGQLVNLRIERYSGAEGLPRCLLLIEDASLKERFRQEQEKVQRGELLAQLSQDISVGIRAPLTAIKTFAQLFPERVNDPEFCEQFQSILSEEVQRLHVLTENISTLNKFTTTTQQKQKSFTLAQCTETAKCLLGSAWSQVEVRFPTELPAIDGNPERISEALYHLLSNALEAIADMGHGKILLTASQGQLGKTIRTVEITIGDNRKVKKVGGFIDNSHLGSEDTIKRADLRLSIVSKIAHENAGALDVQSTDHGVFVKLILPTAGENK